MEKDTSLSSLYAYLKGFHLSDSLVLIGAINSALKYGLKDFSKENIAPYVIEWLQKHCKTHQNYLTIYLDTGRLARYLLLSGANDYRNKRLELKNDSFAIALNMTGAIYDTELEKRLFAEDGAPGLFARMTQKQFPLQADQQSVIGRGHLLFVQLAGKFMEGYSFDQKMSEYYGMGAYEFVATGMTLWMKTNGYESGLLAMEIPAMKDVASDANQIQFLRLSSGTPENYRRYIRGENWKSSDQLKDTYGAEPFNRMPAVAIAHSMLYKAGTFVIPQPRYFLDRASSGIFYLLADKEQEIARNIGNKGQNPFRKEFGHVYRKYAGIQLGQKNSKFQFIDMDEDFDNRTNIRIPDFALVKDSICVLFEIKTTLLKIDARSYFEPAVLKSEIMEGNFKKALTQLHSFAENIINGKIDDSRFKNITQVIKVIIGYEDVFVLNTVLLPLVQEAYKDSASALQLGSVSDLDIMGTIVSENLDLVEIIAKKASHPDERSYSFIGSWDQKYGKKNPILIRAFDDLMHRMIGNTSHESSY